MEDSLYRISVKGLIKDAKGNMLVIQTTVHDGWELPGGGMDHGEEPHEALERELREELGVTSTELSQEQIDPTEYKLLAKLGDLGF